MCHVKSIVYLCQKEINDTSLHEFSTEAQVLYKGWVSKPKAERGVVPQRSRTNTRPVSLVERAHLLLALTKITSSAMDKKLLEEREKVKLNPRTSFDDAPVPLDLLVSKPSTTSSKRHSDDASQINEPVKRSKLADPFVKPDKPAVKAEFSIFSRKPSDSSLPPPVQGNKPDISSRVADTSFASSHNSSLFDESNVVFTQETVPDIEKAANKNGDSQGSENFGSSFDPATFDQTDPSDPKDVSTDVLEDNLRSRLEGIFRELIPFVCHCKSSANTFKP